MVLAWFMNNSDEDKRLEHHQEPPLYVSLEELRTNTGVLYFKLDPEIDTDKLKKIKEDRGYSYSDLIEISVEKLPNYEEKIKTFYIEHLHRDEEIRYVLDGAGYFDVRDRFDNWIRILVEAGDLLIVPAGIYHRFTLNTKNYIKAERFFVGEPVWTPYNRPDADHLEERKMYLDEQSKGFPAMST